MPWISDALNDMRKPNQAYWEPFVGAGWVLSRIENNNAYNFASDILPELIAMWQALQNGWVPPETITLAQWQIAKVGNCGPALRAFIGFGCSWGGNWFRGSYLIRKNGKSQAAISKRSLMRKLATIPITKFYVADFLEEDPPENNMLIYCDPPYEMKAPQEYRATGHFDNAAFWDRVRLLASRGHIVVVSEYKAPNDFVVIHQKTARQDVGRWGRQTTDDDLRVEKLFLLEVR
jgi:DNA adenine methylase